MTKRDELLTAARRASEVVNEFGIKKRIAEGYTRVDPAFVASEANVTLMYRPLERLLGGFIREGDVAGIIVNSERPRGLVNMTCAHELGHYFLGHDSSADETVEHSHRSSLVEQQANQFAYSILAPRWLVVATMKAKGWSQADLSRPATVYQLSLRLGTSFTAMIWSLVRLMLLSESDAEWVLSYTPKRLKGEALGEVGGTDANSDVWVLDTSDRDRILEPSSEDRFVIDLPNHAGSGHLWTVDELRSEGFTLEPFVRDARVMEKTKVKPVVVGGSGATMRYTLVAAELPDINYEASRRSEVLRRKRHVVSMQEVSPWLSESAPSGAFSFSAEFENIKNGLSEIEKERRLTVPGEGK